MNRRPTGRLFPILPESAFQEPASREAEIQTGALKIQIARYDGTPHAHSQPLNEWHAEDDMRMMLQCNTTTSHL
ncbi:hypothetical protein [Phyllobacterium phragmitis]|uniref:hypothetical protein n=1 Tax=Phyllobacterium phragmitis TaxID=2670329 RepID=UPI0038B2E3A7